MITFIPTHGDNETDNFVVLPEGLDIKVEHAAWNQWYEEVYRPSYPRVKSISFVDWLIQRGARRPTSEELTIFEDLTLTDE